MTSVDILASSSKEGVRSPFAGSLPASLPIEGWKKLSTEGRKKISLMSKPDTARFVFEIAKNWLIITGTIAVAVYSKNIFVSFFAIMIIAGRQNIFGLLMHEQAHYLGIKSRWGDTLTNLFVCYPLLVVSVATYARIHLTHHKYFFTEKDPDIIRKSGKNWTFPMPVWDLMVIFIKDISSLNLIKTIAGKNQKENTLNIKRLGPSYPWLRLAYFIAWVIFLTFTHGWTIFLIYWILPLVTFLQVFVRLGAICEHVYIPEAQLEETTAIIVPTFLESLFYPHLNFFYHVYHHYFPGVPFNRLPEVHKIFLAESLVKEEHIFNSIFKYIKFLVTSGRQADQPA
jgi:fatty acid desaturase